MKKRLRWHIRWENEWTTLRNPDGFIFEVIAIDFDWGWRPGRVIPFSCSVMLLGLGFFLHAQYED